MSIQTAQTYLLPQLHTFWEWDLEERSVHWLTGATIAFPQELATVLERFSVRGFPRFDCLLLVLAALRDSWSPFNTNLEYDKLQLDCFKLALLSDREALQLIHQLDRLNALPRELRLSLLIKTVLCDMVLESLESRCAGADMELVLSGLRTRREDIPSQEILSIPVEAVELWRVDLLALTAGLERISEERLRSRLATGVDEPVQPLQELVDESFSDAIEARELIETLLLERESYAIGRLAKDLLAALYRPARMVPDHSLQMQGYSDITNRGTIDRLLLSELAHDNDTLAVRVANGEALYMRREVPPKSESFERCMLIDCGIRSWGAPRVYSAAIALALTASAPVESKVHCWHAMNGSLERSFFVDQSGLTKHMSELDADLHLGAVIDLWHEQMAMLQHNVEAFLILSRDAWEDAGLRDALRASKIVSLTAAVVDRFGELELVSYTRSGCSTIKQVFLKLHETQDESLREPAPLIVSDKLPRIFQRNPFPLRLSFSNSTYHALDRGLMLGKAHGNRLVLWDQANLGGVTLHSKLPGGPIFWAGRDEDRQTLFVVWRNGTDSKFTVMRFDLSDYSLLEKSVLDLRSDSVQFSVDGSSLVVTDGRSNEIQAWKIGEGTLVDVVKIEQVGVANLFQDRTGNWNALHFNGLGFDEVPVSFKQEPRSERIAFVMVAPNKDGYIALTLSGRLLPTNGLDTKLQYGGKESVLSHTAFVFGDNRWLSFRTKSGSYVVEVLDDGTPGDCFPLTEVSPIRFAQRLVWGAEERGIETNGWISSKAYRNRFHRVAVHNGNLALFRNERALVLHNVRASANWVESKLVFREPLENQAAFEYNKGIEREVGFRVEFARRNQVEAVLDARGLLHLRSLDRSLTELTLTLNDGLASGWTSDGRWFGAAYHCGNNGLTSWSTIEDEVLRPLLDQFSGDPL